MYIYFHFLNTTLGIIGHVTEVIYSELGMQTRVRQLWYPGWVLQMGTEYFNLLRIFLGSSEGPPR